VVKQVSSLDPVNLLSFCFEYRSALVQWDCNRCNKSSKLKRVELIAIDKMNEISTHEKDNPHVHNSCNYNRIVMERGRQVIHKMWRVIQVHDVIRIF